MQKKTPFPTKQEILDYVRDNPDAASKRDIAKAFQIKGSGRISLKALLKEMKDEGLLKGSKCHQHGGKGNLPSFGVVDIISLSPDGEAIGRAVQEIDEEKPTIIYVYAKGKTGETPAVGDRVLARLTPEEDETYRGWVVKKLEHTPRYVVGLFRLTEKGGIISSIDRRSRRDYIVGPSHCGDAKSGDLVQAKLMPRRGVQIPSVHISKKLGHKSDPKLISLIVLHSLEIPTDFSDKALAEAKKNDVPSLGDREDLRNIPLVTIDGADAKDFDDAVWAEPDPDTEGGWHLIVAIADVAHYVKAHDALDQDAYERGNSVYFPDRVVPMLPEALSNGTCSLKPHEERACLAVHLWIDGGGQLKRYKFVRGLMKSQARLTYDHVQAIYEKKASDSKVDPLLHNLFGAYATLKKAREKRGTLDLNVPERKVTFSESHHVAEIVPVEQNDSNRLIEEFMILANVASAQALKKMGKNFLYRVHDTPDPTKLEGLLTVLKTMGFSVSRSGLMQPHHFNNLLQKTESHSQKNMISDLVLRVQSQAIYSPKNIGHFGLSLKEYTHFTSPIRRYSDLLVHRALISAFGLGDGGLEEPDAHDWFEIGEHLVITERRAMKAERESLERYIISYMEDHVDAIFKGRIAGVNRHGLFIQLNETGANGFIPCSALTSDYYTFHSHIHALIGRHGNVYALGDAVTVQLIEANSLTNSLLFKLIDHEGHMNKNQLRKAGPAPRTGKSFKGKSKTGKKKLGKKQR
ncbi:MAG: ribonuclease R [Alphaproteobacteria bacterium]|nr:ribonuclease R [Alphaproteobacteria bacterium]MBT5390378.1 ribonuclease R [Alphaproteobacteria bacterium]